MRVGEEDSIEGASWRKIMSGEVIGDDGARTDGNGIAVAAIDEDIVVIGRLNPYCIAISDVDDVNFEGICGWFELFGRADLFREDGELRLGGIFFDEFTAFTLAGDADGGATVMAKEVVPFEVKISDFFFVVRGFVNAFFGFGLGCDDVAAFAVCAVVLTAIALASFEFHADHAGIVHGAIFDATVRAFVVRRPHVAAFAILDAIAALIAHGQAFDAIGAERCQRMRWGTRIDARTAHDTGLILFAVLFFAWRARDIVIDVRGTSGTILNTEPPIGYPLTFDTFGAFVSRIPRVTIGAELKGGLFEFHIDTARTRSCEYQSREKESLLHARLHHKPRIHTERANIRPKQHRTL